jgi:hypothetical protein
MNLSIIRKLIERVSPVNSGWKASSLPIPEGGKDIKRGGKYVTVFQRFNWIPVPRPDEGIAGFTVQEEQEAVVGAPNGRGLKLWRLLALTLFNGQYSNEGGVWVARKTFNSREEAQKFAAVTYEYATKTVDPSAEADGPFSASALAIGALRGGWTNTGKAGSNEATEFEADLTEGRPKLTDTKRALDIANRAWSLVGEIVGYKRELADADPEFSKRFQAIQNDLYDAVMELRHPVIEDVHEEAGKAASGTFGDRRIVREKVIALAAAVRELEPYKATFEGTDLYKNWTRDMGWFDDVLRRFRATGDKTESDLSEAYMQPGGVYRLVQKPSDYEFAYFRADETLKNGNARGQVVIQWKYKVRPTKSKTHVVSKSWQQDWENVDPKDIPAGVEFGTKESELEIGGGTIEEAAVSARVVDLRNVVMRAADIARTPSVNTFARGGNGLSDKSFKQGRGVQFDMEVRDTNDEKLQSFERALAKLLGSKVEFDVGNEVKSGDGTVTFVSVIIHDTSVTEASISPVSATIISQFSPHVPAWTKEIRRVFGAGFKAVAHVLATTATSQDAVFKWNKGGSLDGQYVLVKVEYVKGNDTYNMTVEFYPEIGKIGADKTFKDVMFDDFDQPDKYLYTFKNKLKTESAPVGFIEIEIYRNSKGMFSYVLDADVLDEHTIKRAKIPDTVKLRSMLEDDLGSGINSGAWREALAAWNTNEVTGITKLSYAGSWKLSYKSGKHSFAESTEPSYDVWISQTTKNNYLVTVSTFDDHVIKDKRVASLEDVAKAVEKATDGKLKASDKDTWADVKMVFGSFTTNANASISVEHGKWFVRSRPGKWTTSSIHDTGKKEDTDVDAVIAAAESTLASSISTITTPTNIGFSAPAPASSGDNGVPANQVDISNATKSMLAAKRQWEAAAAKKLGVESAVMSLPFAYANDGAVTIRFTKGGPVDPFDIAGAPVLLIGIATCGKVALAAYPDGVTAKAVTAETNVSVVNWSNGSGLL